MPSALVRRGYSSLSPVKLSSAIQPSVTAVAMMTVCVSSMVPSTEPGTRTPMLAPFSAPITVMGLTLSVPLSRTLAGVS